MLVTSRSPRVSISSLDDHRSMNLADRSRNARVNVGAELARRWRGNQVAHMHCFAGPDRGHSGSAHMLLQGDGYTPGRKRVIIERPYVAEARETELGHQPMGGNAAVFRHRVRTDILRPAL